MASRIGHRDRHRDQLGEPEGQARRADGGDEEDLLGGVGRGGDGVGGEGGQGDRLGQPLVSRPRRRTGAVRRGGAWPW